jgi:hypothetical protein
MKKLIFVLFVFVLFSCEIPENKSCIKIYNKQLNDCAKSYPMTWPDVCYPTYSDCYVECNKTK